MKIIVTVSEITIKQRRKICQPNLSKSEIPPTSVHISSILLFCHMFTSHCPIFSCLIRDYICLVSNGFAYLIFLILVYLLPLISDEDQQSFDNFSQFYNKNGCLQVTNSSPRELYAGIAHHLDSKFDWLNAPKPVKWYKLFLCTATSYLTGIIVIATYYSCPGNVHASEYSN